MSDQQMFGIFIAVSGVGWLTLIALVITIGKAIWGAIDNLREQIAKMVSRDEFERRHMELGQRIDHAHRRIDDIFTTQTDPGLGGKR